MVGRLRYPLNWKAKSASLLANVGSGVCGDHLALGVDHAAMLRHRGTLRSSTLILVVFGGLALVPNWQAQSQYNASEPATGHLNDCYWNGPAVLPTALE
jgi:hypothetical protein